jgi:hypothetical protein
VNYTRRHLSVSTDKLPAISGIAQEFATILKDTYIGGLWKSVLLSDLLWVVIFAKPRPTTYRAPSWSWASVDSPVRWDFPNGWESDAKFDWSNCEPYAEVVDCHVSPVVSYAPYSALQSGYLKLRCRLVRAKWLKEATGNRWLLFPTFKRGQDIHDFVFSTNTSDDATDEPGFDDSLSCWCLDLLTSQHMIVGLVLKRIDDKHYKLVGAFSRAAHPQPKDFWLLEDSGKYQQKKEEYQKLFGSGKQSIITII